MLFLMRWLSHNNNNNNNNMSIHIKNNKKTPDLVKMALDIIIIIIRVYNDGVFQNSNEFYYLQFIRFMKGPKRWIFAC